MKYSKHVEYLFLAGITGIGGVCANYISKMSDSIQEMSVSVQELNSRFHVLSTKMGYSDEMIKDHENRLRRIEKRGK